jgi:hypothetical protein
MAKMEYIKSNNQDNDNVQEEVKVEHDILVSNASSSGSPKEETSECDPKEPSTPRPCPDPNHNPLSSPTSSSPDSRPDSTSDQHIELTPIQETIEDKVKQIHEGSKGLSGLPWKICLNLRLIR